MKNRNVRFVVFFLGVSIITVAMLQTFSLSGAIRFETPVQGIPGGFMPLILTFMGIRCLDWAQDIHNRSPDIDDWIYKRICSLKVYRKLLRTWVSGFKANKKVPRT